MREVVILSGVRTPFGRGLKGTLKDTRPDTMVAAVIKEAVARSKVTPAEIEALVVEHDLNEIEREDLMR